MTIDPDRTIPDTNPPFPSTPALPPPVARRQLPRGPLVLATVGAFLGAVFAYISTADFVLHLDRQVHPLHCSLIPGAGPQDPEEGAAGCHAAMMSPHSSFFRGQMWGGIPVSLLALGTFAFLFAFTLTLLIAPPKESRRPAGFLALAALLPLGASLTYFVIAVVSVGQLCTTCVGIYLSTAIFVGGVGWLLARMRREGTLSLQPAGWWLAWAIELALIVAIPVAAYRATLPSYDRAIVSCGRLARADGPRRATVELRTAHPRTKALFIVDPLCPACKALHERLDSDGRLDDFDARAVLFPLDSKCNWMLDRPLHPGACVVARGVLCAGDRARDVLEWAYSDQKALMDLARHDEAALERKVARQFGVGECMASRETERRLEAGLQWAVDNRLPVMTPQLYLGGQRVCDEDTDLGLDYAIGRLLRRGR